MGSEREHDGRRWWDVATATAVLLMSRDTQASGIVRTLDETDSLTFLRLRSQKHEIMVAPDKDFTLIVVQNPNAE